MVEIEIELTRRRLHRTRRWGEVVLALVATALVLTTVLVAAWSSSDPGGEPDRSPGAALGIEIPHGPLGPLGPGDPPDSPPSTGAEDDRVAGSAGSLPGARGQGPGPSDGSAPDAQPSVADSGPDDTADQADPDEATRFSENGDGPITTVVDPVLRGVGSIAPAVEPVRQGASGLTGCLDEALVLLQDGALPGCVLPVRRRR